MIHLCILFASIRAETGFYVVSFQLRNTVRACDSIAGKTSRSQYLLIVLVFNPL